MSDAYDPSLLPTNTTMQVRWWVKDTDDSAYLFQDSEIEFALSLLGGNALRVAASLARRKATELAENGESTSIGGVSISNADAGAVEWAAFADELEELFRQTGGAPVNASYGSEDMMERNHLFYVGQFDDPGLSGWPTPSDVYPGDFD